MSKIRLFSNRNAIKIIDCKTLPNEELFIKFYVDNYCTNYGAVIFIDVCKAKRTFIMNWNLPAQLIEAIQLFMNNKIKREELLNLNSIF